MLSSVWMDLSDTVSIRDASVTEAEGDEDVLGEVEGPGSRGPGMPTGSPA
jgi:hypothetical protein